MKAGKNKNSGLLSDTETPWENENGVSSEKPWEVEEKERDLVADEDEDVGTQEEELAVDEKPKLADGFYEIETVRRKRIRKGKAQYLIKWLGWPETANTWEPVENLMTCYDAIDAFEESLLSGKQRSTCKHKRTHGITLTQIKRKQQQQEQKHSPADATYDVTAVKVSVTNKPVPSPPLAFLNVIDHVDTNASGSNNIKVAKVANGKDSMLDSSVKEIEEQKELHLKLSELKGVMVTKETSVDSNASGLNNIKVDKVANGKDSMLDSTVKEIEEHNELHLKCSELTGVMATKETSVDRYNNGLASGLSMANGTEPLQSGHCTGAKRRKSASVRRFKRDTTSGVVKDPQVAVANGTSGYLVEFMQEEIHDHGFVGNAFGCNNKHDDSRDTHAITEVIRALKHSTSTATNGLQEVSVIFLAKRSDGKNVMVDNKFLKMNDPLLLINFYEKNLRYHPSE